MQLWLVISSWKWHFQIYSCPLSTLIYALQEGACKTFSCLISNWQESLILPQSFLFNFYGRNCTSVMSQANESSGLCSWWTHSCHEAGLEWKTNTQINGDIINCRNVTELEFKSPIVKFLLLNAPVGFRAMEIHLHSSVNGHGWAQTLLTDGKSCELATACNPNAWESLRADLELCT